jgi:hypothetical protein
MKSAPSFAGKIRSVWRQAARDSGFKAKYFPATNSFENLISSQQLENKRHIHLSLKNWLIILDEFGLFIFVLYMICFTKFSSYQKAKIRRAPTAETVNTFLLGAIVTQLVILRDLVLKGFDANAKQVARLLSEYIDVFNLLQLNPSLIDEFHASHITPVETNKFWHKHISKGKLRARVLNGINQKFPELGVYLSEMEEWRTDELRVISAFAHPSFISAYVTASVGGTYNRAGSGVLGRPDLHSVRTLRFTFYSLAEFIFVNNKLEFAQSVLSQPQGKKDELITFVEQHKPFLTLLAFYTIMNINSTSLVVPKSTEGTRRRTVRR